MAVQDFLSCALGQKDQSPNHHLASRIVAGEFSAGELVAFFETKPHLDLRKDVVLTLAYVAEQSPDLVVPYVDFLLQNFHSKINRVVWGSMIALAHMAPKIPDKMFQSLPAVIDAMHASTVVGRDNGFKILVVCYATEKYREDVFALILEEIRLAPPNQVGQYAERIMEVILPEHTAMLRKALEEIREELTDTHHLRRMEKNLRKLHR